MPCQLIYTSTPSGLTPGRSGFCVVARSRSLPERLVSALERISIYEPPHGRPVIFTFRNLAVGTASYGVLSRYCDAGLDHTSRKNYLAHHLVFDTAEMTLLPPPAEIARRWKGWCDSWTSSPQWLSESTLPAELKSPETNLPASTWKTLTKDAANAALLCPDGIPVETLLDSVNTPCPPNTDALLRLFAEASLLLRGSPWACGFTTYAQTGDTASQIPWRVTGGGNAAEDFPTTRHIVRFCDLGTSADISALARLARVGKQAPPPRTALVTVKSGTAFNPKSQDSTTLSGFKKPPIPSPPPTKAEKAGEVPANTANVESLKKRPDSVPKLVQKPEPKPVPEVATPDAPLQPTQQAIPSFEKLKQSPENDGLPLLSSEKIDGPESLSDSGSKSHSIQIALIFGALILGILLVAGAVFAFFTFKKPGPGTGGHARETLSHTPITASQIQNAFDTDVLNRELTTAMAGQRWETAAQVWVKLLASDRDFAEQRKSRVLPRIQENLVAALCGRFDRQAAKLKDKKFKLEHAQKNQQELANAVKLVSDIGAQPSADVQRRFEMLGVYFDLLESCASTHTKGKTELAESVLLLSPDAGSPHITAPRIFLQERTPRNQPPNVTASKQLLDFLARVNSQGFRFVLYPESERDVARHYPDAKNSKRGSNQINHETINNIRKRAVSELKDRKQKQLDKEKDKNEGLLRELQNEIFAIDGRPKFLPEKGVRLLDQPNAWVIALCDGKEQLIPLIRFK